MTPSEYEGAKQELLWQYPSADKSNRNGMLSDVLEFTDRLGMLYLRTFQHSDEPGNQIVVTMSLLPATTVSSAEILIALNKLWLRLSHT